MLRSPLAKSDLIEIWHFIADESPEAADRFLDFLAEKFVLLSDWPEMGREREELGPSLRSFPVGRYVIVYRPADQGVEIVRVLSAYRDVEPLFQ